MRIDEIASAEEQLALWKLISDNTWSAISQQAEAERRQRAEKAAKAKLKPKIGGKRGGRKSLPPPPRITPPPPPTKPPAPQPPAAAAQPAAPKVSVDDKQPKQANTAAAQPKTTLSTAQAAKPAVKQQQPTPQAVKLQSPYPTQPTLTPQQQQLQRQEVGNVAAATAQMKTV